MTGLDCNILVQLALADHPANARTIAAVQAEAQRGESLAFAPLVAAEFLHVITDDRRFTPPLMMDVATEWLEEFMANTGVVLVQPTKEGFELSIKWLRQFKLGRKRILDTQLAAIYHTAGIRRFLTSNPVDFSVFQVFELLTP